MSSSESALTATLSLPEAFALACRTDAPLVLRATHRVTGATQTHTIDAPYAFLGRTQVVGVRLDDPSVSQCHAYLQVIEGVPYCIDLGSRNGVVWNDGTQGRGWVEPGHTLRVGIFDVRIEGSGPPFAAAAGHSDHDVPGAPSLSPAVLEVHSPAHPTGTLHSLDRPITLIGRHPGCDLRFLDESVSYFQCALVNTPDGAWFVDIPNRKGVAVNGRLSRLARLRDGDLLEIGRVSLLVRLRPAGGAPVVVGGALTPVVSVGADPVDAVSTKVAEGVVGAMAPFRDMMGQFQQCFVTMAQMFAAMQQEHAAMVSEQMKQMQE